MEKTKFNDKAPAPAGAPKPQILPMNEKDLFEVKVIDDYKAGKIYWAIPISLNGIQDPLRAQRFFGETKINTPLGMKDIRFELEATNLSDALIEWPRKLEFAISEMAEAMESARQRMLLAGARPGPAQ